MNLGMGVLGFIDTTLGGETEGLPDPARYKEAVLAHLRIVPLGSPTTVTNLDANLNKFCDGNGGQVLQGPHIFPLFERTENQEG